MRCRRLVVPIVACLALSCGQSGEGQGVQPASVGPAGGPQPRPPDANEQAMPAEGGEEGALVEITLFFAGAGGQPEPELREVPPGGPLSQRVRLLVQELAAGPESRGLGAVLPRDAALREFYLVPGGTGFLDMNAAFESGLSRGSEDAILAVRCLVDSLAINFPEIERVKILVEGEEPREFGGHLDLSRPLLPDRRAAPYAPEEEGEV